MFMHVPGLKVVAPSNAHDAKGCMIAAIRDDNPVIFVEHRLLYSTETEVPDGAYDVEPGKAARLHRTATTSPSSAFPTCAVDVCAPRNCWPTSASPRR